METIKCVVLGDTQVGKSALIQRRLGDEFSEDYAPTGHDSYVFLTMIDDTEHSVEVHDTSGGPDLDEATYEDTDVFIVTYSISSRESFDSIRTKWVPNLRSSQSSDAPFIIVGTHLDEREENNDVERATGFVTLQQAERLADLLGAKACFEVSSKSGLNVNEVFDEAALLGLASLRTNMPQNPGFHIGNVVRAVISNLQGPDGSPIVPEIDASQIQVQIAGAIGSFLGNLASAREAREEPAANALETVQQRFAEFRQMLAPTTPEAPAEEGNATIAMVQRRFAEIRDMVMPTPAAAAPPPATGFDPREQIQVIQQKIKEAIEGVLQRGYVQVGERQINLETARDQIVAQIMATVQPLIQNLQNFRRDVQA